MTSWLVCQRKRIPVLRVSATKLSTIVTGGAVGTRVGVAVGVVDWPGGVVGINVGVGVIVGVGVGAGALLTTVTVPPVIVPSIDWPAVVPKLGWGSFAKLSGALSSPPAGGTQIAVKVMANKAARSLSVAKGGK